jgi:hypothetical protein
MIGRSEARVSAQAALWLCCALLIGGGLAAVGLDASGEERTPSHVGRSFLFDYGDLVIRVRYLSDARLAWEQVKGPQAGMKGEEQYGHSVVRPDVVFFWWQEKDSSVVTQVVDFGQASVHTTWTSPDKTLAGFQGKIRPVE